MGFPTEHKDARDAYYHLRDFGQMNHAQAVYDLAETLRLVGEGKWTRRSVEKALAAKDRAAGGPTAPPDGLYLVSVGY